VDARATTSDDAVSAHRPIERSRRAAWDDREDAHGPAPDAHATAHEQSGHAGARAHHGADDATRAAESAAKAQVSVSMQATGDKQQGADTDRNSVAARQRNKDQGIVDKLLHMLRSGSDSSLQPETSQAHGLVSAAHGEKRLSLAAERGLALRTGGKVAAVKVEGARQRQEVKTMAEIWEETREARRVRRKRITKYDVDPKELEKVLESDVYMPPEKIQARKELRMKQFLTEKKLRFGSSKRR
jgi:hypothetical protein